MEIFFASHLHWAAFAAQSVVAAAWEGALLVCCVALCLRLLPGVSAAARSIVWVAVLMLLAALPFLRKTGLSPGGDGGRLEIDIRWAWLLTAVWVAFAVVRLVQLLRSGWHVARVSAQARELSPEELEALQLVGMEMPRFRSVKICASVQVGVPCVAGFFRPRVLLPPSLLRSLSAADLRQIVQHELEHLRRRDDWINLLQKCSLVLLPLNPGLWWVERRLCVERELACDDCVLERTGAPKAYAVCLANLAERSMVRRNVSLVLGAWRRRSELAKRIYRILQAPEGKWGSGVTVTALSFLLVFASAGTFALGRSARLISFSSNESSGAAGTSLTAENAMPSRPVAAISTMAPARAVLVSAVVARHPLPVRRRARKSFVEPLTVVASVAHPRSLAAHNVETLVVWKKTVKHPIRPALASEDSHFTYAAIPLPGGWLIVQL